jgi:hypothetical protein
MSNSLIRAALETRLKAWADAQVPRIPIAFESVSFSKPSSGVYLEPVLLPNVTVNSELSGSRHTYLGIFEVRCWCPVGSGMGIVDKLASDVIQLFPILPKVGNVSIENTPYAERPQYDEAGWVIVPVLMFYRYESQT